MQTASVAFDAPNFSCSWNLFSSLDSNDDLVMILSGQTLNIVSPTRGQVKAIDLDNVVAACWAPAERDVANSILVQHDGGVALYQDHDNWSAPVGRVDKLIESKEAGAY